MKTISSQFTESVQRSHINELRQQLETANNEAERLGALVKEIPRLILNARLDAKQGKETKLAAKFYV